MKVIITERALYQRINRRLKQNDEKLCTARGESIQNELGRFYTVETGQHVRPDRAMSSGVVYVHVNLETLAQKLGVIQPWEELEEK